jgi:hypothetical protein
MFVDDKKKSRWMHPDEWLLIDLISRLEYFGYNLGGLRDAVERDFDFQELGMP